jgi:hypothetical protein
MEVMRNKTTNPRSFTLYLPESGFSPRLLRMAAIQHLQYRPRLTREAALVARVARLAEYVTDARRRHGLQSNVPLQKDRFPEVHVLAASAR